MLEKNIIKYRDTVIQLAKTIIEVDSKTELFRTFEDVAKTLKPGYMCLGITHEIRGLKKEKNICIVLNTSSKSIEKHAAYNMCDIHCNISMIINYLVDKLGINIDEIIVSIMEDKVISALANDVYDIALIASNIRLIDQNPLTAHVTVKYGVPTKYASDIKMYTYVIGDNYSVKLGLLDNLVELHIRIPRDSSETGVIVREHSDIVSVEFRGNIDVDEELKHIIHRSIASTLFPLKLVDIVLSKAEEDIGLAKLILG